MICGWYHSTNMPSFVGGPGGKGVGGGVGVGVGGGVGLGGAWVGVGNNGESSGESSGDWKASSGEVVAVSATVAVAEVVEVGVEVGDGDAVVVCR
jgi:hypothetical protein